ncbi:hypothetical protein INF35_12520 [Subdoligranulum sp. DSM 109015]|uniref:Uncharacterized protein n=1 Tax=Gemmiger gallinarum TaxID=2779354 RepID=A0ABR9R628_9FIRM|nr:hypothetical protein [Gemmiger gallinarum]MBE5038614.1 hypothetical protein [Gemmiger gallinarum]
MKRRSSGNFMEKAEKFCLVPVLSKVSQFENTVDISIKIWSGTAERKAGGPN